MPVGLNMQRTGPWKEVGRLLSRAIPQVAILGALNSKEEAKLAAKLMKKAINSGGRSNNSKWAKLSPWTRLAKGSGRTLRNSKALVKAIGIHKVGAMAWDAGISSSAVNAEGRSLADIGRIHEEGAKFWVTVTKRMILFLTFRAKELGLPPKKGRSLQIGSRILIVIPKRSFVEDTRAAHFSTGKMVKRLAVRTIATMTIVKEFRKGFRSVKNRKVRE